MVHFLKKCMDGYDHCAWLDGDIFVHKAKIPWVEEAILVSMKDPNVIIGRPTSPGSTEEGWSKFSSRYFVYHKKGLKRLLPLTGLNFPTDPKTGKKIVKGFLYEDLVNSNLKRLADAGGDPDGTAMFESSRGGSWAIHPPEYGEMVAMREKLTHACGGRSLASLISVVELGSEGGESADKWSAAGKTEMDGKLWAYHVKNFCNRHKQKKVK